MGIHFGLVFLGGQPLEFLGSIGAQVMADIGECTFGGSQQLGILSGSGQLQAGRLGFEVEAFAMGLEAALWRQIGIFALGGSGIGSLNEFRDLEVRLPALRTGPRSYCPGRP